MSGTAKYFAATTTAIGTSNQAAGTNSFAAGYGAGASGEDSIGIGSSAKASGNERFAYDEHSRHGQPYGHRSIQR